MKQTIAIIGLENPGSKLASRLVDSPYRLLVDQHFVNTQTLSNQLLQSTPVADVFLISAHYEALAAVSILVTHAGMNPIVIDD